MAGDWIKMKISLASDPAVISIAARLDHTEFSVVGMLHHLWSWADTQSRDGHAPGVTEKWVDRYVQCDGFAQAMQSVGWLIISDDGLEFPRFDRHNGDNAKTRALASSRQKKKRSNDAESAPDLSRNERDESVTREEKRREEKKDKSSCDQQAESQKARIPFTEIFDAYAHCLPELPQLRIIDESRKAMIRSRWNADERFQSVDFWFRFFKHVSESDFLMGRTDRPWTGCCFDWLLKPANFRKIVEGNYTNA